MSYRFLDEDVASFLGETDAIFVPHPRFEEAFHTIGKSIETSGLTREPLCLHVSGPTGVGKSTLRRKLQAAFEVGEEMVRVENGRAPPMEAAHRPLLQFELVDQPTVKRLQRQILKALGDPAWTERDVDIAYDRIVTLLKASRTRGLLVDEAQRLVDRNGEVVAQNVLDWVKKLLADTGIAIVFLGLGRLGHLFGVDAQIQRRWASPIRLEPYAWPEREPYSVGHPKFRFTADQTSFFALAVAFERALPKPLSIAASILNPDPVVAYDNGKRFFYASRGATGWLKKLWQKAVLDSGGEAELTLGLLERAFESAFRVDHPTAVNPFGKAWAGQLPPHIPDDTLLLHAKKRRRTKAEERRDLADALTKT